jgi:hypothetical protein
VHRNIRAVLVAVLLAVLGIAAPAAMAGNGHDNGNGPPSGAGNVCSPGSHGVPAGTNNCQPNGGGGGNCGQNQSGNTGKGAGNGGNDNGYGNKPGCGGSTTPPPPQPPPSCHKYGECPPPCGSKYHPCPPPPSCASGETGTPPNCMPSCGGCPPVPCPPGSSVTIINNVTIVQAPSPSPQPKPCDQHRSILLFAGDSGLTLKKVQLYIDGKLRTVKRHINKSYVRFRHVSLRGKPGTKAKVRFRITSVRNGKVRTHWLGRHSAFRVDRCGGLIAFDP